MSETESEKVVKDTVRYMKKQRLIFWGQKFWQKQMGKFRKKAPMDFVLLDHYGVTNFIEVKEVGRKSIPYGHFKDEQRRLLNAQFEATKFWCVLRYFSGDLTRNNDHYWEEYYLAPGKKAPSLDQTGGLNRSDMEGDDDVIMLASDFRGVKKGFSEDHGTTSRGNKARGLERLVEIFK